MKRELPAFSSACLCIDPSRCTNRLICKLRAIPGCTVNPGIYARGERVPAAARGGGLRLQIVRTGIAAASATMQDGRRQIMCVLVPGDVICPFDLADAECWAEALTETETWEVVVPMNGHGLDENPDLGRLLFDLSHKLLERALTHVVQLGRFDGTERLCAFLLDMARRTGRRRGTGWCLSLPMSREDIADYLGLNAETVSRIFTRIKKDGIARFHSPTECEIPDLTRLEARVPIRGIGGSRDRATHQDEAHP